MEKLEFVEGELTLKRLVDGPTFKAKCYNKYRVNGFVFSPSEYETTKSTQNNGVSMKAITKYRTSAKDKNYKEDEATYYGVVKQIIELDYTVFRQTVFYYDWVRVEDKTNGCIVDPESNLIMVNMEKLKGHEKEGDEPFILASQASQVLYSKDQIRLGWYVVLMSSKRLTKNMDTLEDLTLFSSSGGENTNLENIIKEFGYEL
ncbi:uncharacterized protein LOC131216904 isoform X1 [Magnolia sinica]|uniref:uncharacterized protein LOC131216904 isoform X1 n=1 Tax=Magnolia sinica TaxID=86752 RepID=UPI002659D4A4|nr:uncharacterized protein LOC131216904 isoform X1 [Magnolia sinica]XP_058067492.1 uncharacterized protein LOC131216904 isoform X1 [Magnolia sinica]